MKSKSSLETYLDEICRTPLLSREEEIQLARRVQRGDSAARDHMIRANLRFVVKVAKDYVGYGLGLTDLIAEGNIGLMKAVERFDPDRGAKFSTYAVWWIKQAIRRALSNQSRTVRLPVHMVEKINQVRRESRRIEEKTGRSASSRELQQATGLTPSQLRLAHESGQVPASLDAPVYGEDGAKLHEQIQDDRIRDPLAWLSDADLVATLNSALDVLGTRERAIITARFGLEGRPLRTLEHLGKRFGVSRERIRQIQQAALKKVRAELRRRETPLPAAVRSAALKTAIPPLGA